MKCFALQWFYSRTDSMSKIFNSSAFVSRESIIKSRLELTLQYFGIILCDRLHGIMRLYIDKLLNLNCVQPSKTNYPGGIQICFSKNVDLHCKI